MWSILSEVECVHFEDSTKVCGVEPWFSALRDKIPVERSRGPVILASRVSWFTRLVLRVLRVRALRFKGNLVVWGYIERGDVDDVVIVELSKEDLYRVYSHRLPKFIALPLSEPYRVLVYVAVGGAGIVVNLVVAVLTQQALVKSLGLVANPLASTTGFEASVLFNFTLHETVTFRGTGLEKSGHGVLSRLLKYHVASVVSWVTQVTMASTLPVLLKTPFWLAQFAGIIAGFVVNFILGYMYTWSWHRLKRA